jgi:hypothetical protein
MASYPKILTYYHRREERCLMAVARTEREETILRRLIGRSRCIYTGSRPAAGLSDEQLETLSEGLRLRYVF